MVLHECSNLQVASQIRQKLTPPGGTATENQFGVQRVRAIIEPPLQCLSARLFEGGL